MRYRMFWVVLIFFGSTIFGGSQTPKVYFVRLPYTSASDLANLFQSGVRVRHLSEEGWALAEADSERVSGFPSNAEVVGIVRPDYAYYIVGGYTERPAGVDVLLTWGKYTLLGVPLGQERRFHDPLSDHAHWDALLAPEVSPDVLYPVPTVQFAPNAARQQFVENLVGQFSEQEWFGNIAALTENGGTNSRFSFRVREAQQFDGNPAPDDACDRAGDWIADKLRSYNYWVQDDPFSHTRFTGLTQKVGEYRMRNIVGTKAGRGPNRNRVILLSAHYDSIASKTEGWDANWRDIPAPGADDNATGVAAVLEAARLLAKVDTDFTVKFVFFSGEELGLFGSRHFAKAARQAGEDILAVLNVDMLGFDTDGNPDVHVAANRQSRWLLTTIRSIAAQYEWDVRFQPVSDSDFVFSDHASFWENGYSAVLFSEESDFDSPEFNKDFHSGKDTLDRINRPFGAESARFFVTVATELARPLLSPSSGASAPIPDAVRVLGASVFPNPFIVASDNPVQVQYQLNREANVRVEVLNTVGEAIYSSSLRTEKYGLNAPVAWNGRTNTGERVPPGLYFVAIHADAEDGTVASRTVRLLIVPNDSWLERFHQNLTPKP